MYAQKSKQGIKIIRLHCVITTGDSNAGTKHIIQFISILNAVLTDKSALITLTWAPKSHKWYSSWLAAGQGTYRTPNEARTSPVGICGR